jgi:D-xylose transport system substrate-binding protein
MKKEFEMKSNRILLALFTLVVIASLLVGCGGTKPAASEKVKVGLSFSDFATERWKNEEVLMRGLLEGKGYEVISAEANHDVKLQNDQIDNMVSQGVKGLLVVAEDGDAVVTSVDKAADAGVKVIAYDRLIKTSKIAAYLSFDNVEVGRQQALGVMAAIDADNWDVAANGPARVVQLAGSPTDNNATLFTKGQTEVLQPYVDSGKIEIVAQQGVENWDAANALKLMENILTAQNNDVDAVVASNDGTALGALQAMKAQGLAGKVPISGQDATADGSNSIVKGELTVSILKDIRNLSPLAIEVMDKLLKGEAVDGMKNFSLAELTVDDTKKGEVPCVFLEVQQVNKDNVYDLVVKSGFQSYDDVYRDIPEADRPAKPGEAPKPAAEKIKVGLSFSDFATERWKNEEVLMRGLLEGMGYEVISAEANHDVKLQNDQIDNMVTQGVKGLLVVAEDGDAVVTSVDKAADAGVVVIAYDRLIKTPKIAAYLSFDNVEVGRQQALGVMTAMGLPGSTTWTKDNPMKVVQLAGSPTDNNATLFTKGQTEILQPYVDSGVVTIVAQQGVENWDAANALKLMENILTAQGNKVDAVVASNDGTALGALQAMKAQGLAGKVPISGQDATADGSNSIVKGELTVSILKDIRNLSPLAIEVMDKLIKGETVDGMKNFSLAELTVDDKYQGEVPCVFLEVQQVNKDNVYDLVVKSGFQSYDDVYRDIPEADRPAKP